MILCALIYVATAMIQYFTYTFTSTVYYKFIAHIPCSTESNLIKSFQKLICTCTCESKLKLKLFFSELDSTTGTTITTSNAADATTTTTTTITVEAIY